jgi:hypothetical protein
MEPRMEIKVSLQKGSNHKLTLTRVGKPEDQGPPPDVLVSIASPNSELFAYVDGVQLINAVRALFPELAISVN